MRARAPVCVYSNKDGYLYLHIFISRQIMFPVAFKISFLQKTSDIIFYRGEAPENPSRVRGGDHSFMPVFDSWFLCISGGDDELDHDVLNFLFLFLSMFYLIFKILGFSLRDVCFQIFASHAKKRKLEITWKCLMIAQVFSH